MAWNRMAWLAAVPLTLLACRHGRAQTALELSNGSAPSATKWVLDQPLFEDPLLTGPGGSRKLAPASLQLWTRALASDDVQMQQQAALTVVMASRRGLEGLEVCGPPLEGLLASDQRQVRLTAARAICEIGWQAATDRLLQLARDEELSMAVIVEPTLAAWRVAAARPLWRERLREASSAQRTRLAIRGLVALGDVEVAARLEELATDGAVASTVRLEAAAGRGRLPEPLAIERVEPLLAAPAAPLARLLAVELLQAAEGPRAIELLSELLDDSLGTVAARAGARLGQLAPQVVMGHAEALLARDDVAIQRMLVEHFKTHRTAAAAAPLGGLLASVDDAVRHQSRGLLVELAQAEASRPAVESLVAQLVQSSNRYTLEQGLLLAGLLELKPLAPRVAELLDHKEGPVLVAAGWALRRLAVPETLPAALRRVRAMRRDPDVVPLAYLDEQTSQLFQLFGQLRYAEAEPVLRGYVRKESVDAPKMRSAGIWALGQLHAGQPDAELAKQLSERMLDDFSVPTPEDTLVQYQAAIALGRMGAVDQVAELRERNARSATAVRLKLAAQWSLHKLTGQQFPPAAPSESFVEGWFLEAVGSDAVRR